MKRFVLDCSISAAWCIEDESSATADRCLDMLKKGEAVVPSHWILEMANVFLVAERRRRIEPGDAAEAMELLSSLPITIHDEPRGAMKRIHALAREHELTPYDACYIDLAMQLKLPLASLDTGQRRAAAAASVKLLLRC